MKKLIVILIIIVAAAFSFYRNSGNKIISPSPSDNSSNNSQETNKNQTVVIAENLDTPWGMAFLPDSSIMLVTERKGTVRVIENGKLDPLPAATISSVEEVGEGGLLGITIHPGFKTNNLVYFYYTYSSSGTNTLNRVVRMTYKNKKLTSERIIVDRIPGASNHNGGRIRFGPDKALYISTGDAQEPSLAQDRSSLAGKILRVDPEGKAVSTNPFKNQIFSYGHRNIQGLAWDDKNNLWATEHGRSGALSGLDELNLIEVGKNYGWPEIQGSETRTGMVTAKLNSGSDTWAPGGIAYFEGLLFFTGLRGQALYEVSIQNGDVAGLNEHFKEGFGRIRDVITGPDNMLYIATSNQDGRGSPDDTDDKIIRINPVNL